MAATFVPMRKKSLSTEKSRFSLPILDRRVFTFTWNAFLDRCNTIKQRNPAILIRTGKIFDVWRSNNGTKLGKFKNWRKLKLILTMFATRFFPLISAYWRLINRMLSVSNYNHLNIRPFDHRITFLIAFYQDQKNWISFQQRMKNTTAFFHVQNWNDVRRWLRRKVYMRKRFSQAHKHSHMLIFVIYLRVHSLFRRDPTPLQWAFR